jgi:hypothetical protein
MHPMPPSEIGRAKSRALVRELRMKSPEGWPIAARMTGIRSHERKSAEAQGGGKEEKDFLIQGVGPHRSWGRKRLMWESRSDRAIRDGGRGGRAAEIASQSGDGWVRTGSGGSQRIAPGGGAAVTGGGRVRGRVGGVGGGVR